MLFSNLFFYNNHFERDNARHELIELMQKACLVHQDSAGIYSMLCLGLALEQRLTSYIEAKMSEIGFCQVRLSLLQEGALWEKTQRMESYGSELFKLKNRKNQTFCLSATAEEAMTMVYKDFYQRQKASCHVFQIGNKYRDEMRARSGLIRAKEFVMKDAYSFCSSEEEIQEVYAKVRQAYQEIFHHFGLNVIIKSTASDQMGGNFSEEFLVSSSLADNDESLLEVGHIFQLGTKYSQALGLIDDKGEYVKMACYGIGISRLLMALLEARRDSHGFAADESFNTFDYIIVALDMERFEEVKTRAYQLYTQLKGKGYKVLLDERKASAGKKMNDAELIAAHKRIIVSRQALENDSFELMERRTLQKTSLQWHALLSHLHLL